MPSLSLNIGPRDPRYKKILDAISSRIRLAETGQNKQHARWRKAEERILAYIPESALDRRRDARREAGEPTYTTMQIPYTYALLMASHTYWTSVFFARSPVHQYMGRHGETEQQTQALEALIDYQVTSGGGIGPYYIWLYDAGKYGLGVLGTYWDRQETRYTTITLDDENKKIQTTKSISGYEGNRFYNVNPFDFFPDPRVTVGQFQKGEFCFVKKRISWNDLLRRKAQGFYMNLDLIKTHQGTGQPRDESQSALERPTMFETPGVDASHPSIVEGYEFYIELVPKEWQLSDSDFPEKWVFSITRDLSILFGAQPLGLLHDQFPFDVLEVEVEGYGQYNRGIPDVIESLQNTMDWLVNSHFFNVRAVLNNLFLVDPTKVVMKDFENIEEGGFIRLKPEAFGQDLRTFFHQIPIADVTQMNIADTSVIQTIGERTLGVNDAILGSMNNAGRKTATEVRSATGFGVSRQKTIAEYMSATGVSSHSQKLVMSSQQYFTTEKKFRIVGTLAQEAGAKFLDVRPEEIQGFYDFVAVDGTLPIDRFAQANLWKEILVNVSKIPQVAMQYDLGRVFAWMAHLAGLKNINQFKVEVLPPGAMPSPGMIAAPGATAKNLPSSDTNGTGISLPTAGTAPPPAMQ